jgi:lysine-specific demethylase 3
LGKFKLEWTPAYFIQEFGDRECLITECEQDANKKTTVKEFFGQFGKYADRKQEVWKLKVRGYDVSLCIHCQVKLS